MCMGDHDQAQRSGAPIADNAPGEQDRVDAFVHPTVMQLNALAVGSGPNAPMSQILSLVRSHPEDYDALLRAVHRLWGNQVALQVSIAVPHINLASLGLGGGPGVGAPPAAAHDGAAGESPVTFDATQDQPNGPVTTSAAVGPVTGSVTTQAGNPQTGTPSAVTGGEVEVGGDVGANTHGSVKVGTDAGDNGRTVTGTGSVTHRLGDNVTVGGTASVEGNTATGEVRAQGGATVRVRTSDRTMLQAQGLVDSHGVLTQRLEFSVFQDRVNRLPLTDEARHQILSLYVQGSTGPLIGQDTPFAPQVEGGITIRIPGT